MIFMTCKSCYETKILNKKLPALLHTLCDNHGSSSHHLIETFSLQILKMKIEMNGNLSLNLEFHLITSVGLRSH